MAKKIGLVLSGCGVFDGSEIHESVLALLALKRKGYDVEFLAPDIQQAHTFNHLEGMDTPGDHRNVLVEAARIARGHIRDIGNANAAEFDALVFPGGYGAAKNLSTYAFDGQKMKVNEGVASLIRDMKEARKPMVFICISPMVAARVLGQGVELTVGSDAGACQDIDAIGGRHVVKHVDEVHVDRPNRIISTPAYMYGDASIVEVERGITNAIEELSQLLG